VKIGLRFLSGSILDPKFRERPPLIQVISLKFFVPYFNSRILKFLRPRSWTRNYRSFQKSLGNLEYSEKRNFKDLHIFSAFGLYEKKGCLLLSVDIISNPGFDLKKLESRMNYSYDSPTWESEPVLTGFTVLPHNFYHFMTDYIIPSLALGKTNTKVFIPFSPNNRQREILTFMKIEYLSARFQANHFFSEVEILPSVFHARNIDWRPNSEPFSNYRFNQETITRARSRMMNLLSLNTEVASLRIFISRNGATRSPNDILEIEQIFRENGFVVYNASDFSFHETVEIFQRASLIIGIHGAGLTNMIFAPPKCQIIELDPIFHKMGGEIRPIFRLLSESLHFDYKKVDLPSSPKNWRELLSHY
jgi:capsular polysaccharide biosynthesis protein